MLIPSDDLSQKLYSRKMGLWPELLDDDSVVLVAKLPQYAAKAIYRGVKCELVMSVYEVDEFRIFYLSLLAYDDILNPLAILQPVATQDEQTHFQAIFSSSPVSFHFFDELGIPVLKTECAFDSVRATTALEAIFASGPHDLDVYHPDIQWHLKFEHAVQMGLDVFQKDLPSIRKGKSLVAVTNHVIPLSLTVMEQWTIGYAINTEGDCLEFTTVNQANEGDTFEQFLHFILDDLYGGQCFLRPKIQVSGKLRELADILCLDFETNTICIVQAKAIASLKVSLDRPTERRAASIEKHVKKASKQLAGAIRHIRSDIPILDGKGTVIKIPHRDVARLHAITLVSDMHPSVDWRKIGKYLNEMSESDKYRALFHVFDLQELQHMVANSSSLQTFHNFLLQRWVMVKVHGTAYVRGRTRSLADIQNDI